MQLNMELGSIMMKFKIDKYVEEKNRELDEEEYGQFWCEISMSLKDRT